MSSIAVHHCPSVLARAGPGARARPGDRARHRRAGGGRRPRRRRPLRPSPPSGTQATDHLVSGLVPLALLASRRVGTRAGPPPGIPRRHRDPDVGCFGLDRERRGGLLRPRAGQLRRRLQRLPRDPGRPAAARPRRRDAVALPAARRLAPAPLRPPQPVGAGVLPGALPRRDAARLRLHLDARRPRHRHGRRPAGERPRGDLHHQRRADAARHLHPVHQRRGRDRVPRVQRGAGARADAGAPRLRRPALRPARRGAERRRPERLGVGGREGHGAAPSASCRRSRTSTTGASAASACRSPASRCSRPPRTTTT